MQARRDEILAKKAKLAELKRQRELRAKEVAAGRQSLGDANELLAPAPAPARTEDRKELDSLISSLVGTSRPGSGAPPGAASPFRDGSRTNSVLNAGDGNGEPPEGSNSSNAITIRRNEETGTATQTISIIPLSTVYEFSPSPVKEVFSYSKGVQTNEEWQTLDSRARELSLGGDDGARNVDDVSSPNKRLSRRERDREEELRQNLRQEIEEELKAAKDLTDNSSTAKSKGGSNFPVRALTNEEMNAVTSSDDFMAFVERSSKVIERALDQEYDVLANYALDDLQDDDYDNDGFGNMRGRGRRRMKEVAQFFDERWSRRRMISAIDFSSKFPELVLAAYTKNPTTPHDPDGLVQVWNMHLHDRPEFIFHAQSDILAAKFSPFHPNLIVGGAYSGQVLLWDTRAKSAPVQRTPLTGSGHTHPVYAVDMVGTQNANNIISCSTDGVVCGWTVDMLAQPQEFLSLTCPPPSKSEDLSPTCLSFPQNDPTYFLVGTEEGSIYPCHRYDRAGAKAGVDTRVSYRGHAAPVMSMDFHPAKGPIDLGDLVLTSSLDWNVKLWKVRAPAATATTSITGEPHAITSLLDIGREDVVYDARWSPIKPSVFALVDGAGYIEVWDLNVDTEIPVARSQPSGRNEGRLGMAKSLNKVAWDATDGKRLATGGIDGSLTVFEVGQDLGGRDSARSDEWSSMKRLIARLESSLSSNSESNGL